MVIEDREILALLEQPEGPQLAFLRGKARLEEVAETLVAFANAQGGTLLLGVAGRARAKVEGLADPAAARDLALEAALACTPPLILPLPAPAQAHGETLLAVTVPAGLPQVYALHGKYLRREGATNQPLAPNTLRRLLIERGDVSWERTTPAGATLAELDQRKILAYAERVGPAAEEDSLGFLVRRGCLVRKDEGGRMKDEPPRKDEGGKMKDEPHQSTDATMDGTAIHRSSFIVHPSSFILHPSSFAPTNAGLLLFAQTVEARFPQAEITLVRYRGVDMGDEFEREDVRDTLPEAARRAERWLMERMRKGSRMVGLEREDWTQLPPGAVREALVNAVAHRDYSVRGEGIRVALFLDRLEVYSPGRLPGHVTLANIVEERFSRNESLVQVLADYGLIERLGYGIDRMLRQMAEAGLPPPSFRETAAGFLVTLQGLPADAQGERVDTREWLRMGLNERQVAALIYTGEQRRISNRELQEQYPDVSPETIRRDLADLVERGMLLKVGDKRATYYILK